MANAWVRMRHPDYDTLREMLDDVGRTLQVTASCSDLPMVRAPGGQRRADGRGVGPPHRGRPGPAGRARLVHVLLPRRGRRPSACSPLRRRPAHPISSFTRLDGHRPLVPGARPRPRDPRWSTSWRWPRPGATAPAHRGPPQPAQGPQPLRGQLRVPGVSATRSPTWADARSRRARRRAEEPRPLKRRLRPARQHDAVPAAGLRRRPAVPHPLLVVHDGGDYLHYAAAQGHARQPHPSRGRPRRWSPPSAILATGWPSTPTTPATPTS